MPPSLHANSMAGPAHVDTSNLGTSEPQLRRQSLECLVAVLKSLVAWGTTSTSSVDTSGDKEQAKSLPGEDIRTENVTPDHSMDRLSTTASVSESSRIPTPEQIADDPTKFESAKQRKTTLLEGIKKFNFKPKRVSIFIVCDCPFLESIFRRVSSSSSRLDSSRARRLMMWHSSCSRRTVSAKL